MNKVLEIHFSGWTATPRMPFVISGSQKGGSICLHTPTYSLILGIIGCCLGRIVCSNEVKIGFKYSFDTISKDMETRHRLENKNSKIKRHSDGTSPYLLEFHTSPRLIVWLDRLDWISFFQNPVGTPSLGRSQDILKIVKVEDVEVKSVEKGELSGCMLPFSAGLQAGGQLVQLAESYVENEEIGSGRSPKVSKVFMSIPHDNNQEIQFENIYQTMKEPFQTFYMHQF